MQQGTRAEGPAAAAGVDYAVDQIARFVATSTYAAIPADTRALLKRNTLDSLACAIAALGGEPAAILRAQFREYRGSEQCTLIGGGRTSPDQAALFNSMLVRYVDVLDSFMAPGGLCHPSDNFGAMLAAAEMADKPGEDFLLALAIAYEVQCRFTEIVPVMYRGLNHALQLSLSVAAGAAKLLGLGPEQTANAIAIAGADNVSLAVVHVEPVSNWKGISPGITAMRALYATSLAKRGLTGPKGLFEGPNGLARLFDQPIAIDWEDRSLDIVHRTLLKKYCALVHGQPVLETLFALVKQHAIASGEVASVIADVFQFAYDISGGGIFGDKRHPRTKEQADYNLKYLIAAALLDGEVGPAQLDGERVRRADVQELLQRVLIRPDAQLTSRYPTELPVRITIVLRDGRQYQREQGDYEGAVTRPLSWERVMEKFHWLSEPFADEVLRQEIVAAVADLDGIKLSDLTALLAKVHPAALYPRTRRAI
jgi:2-methylcitrate dehydratase